MGLSYGFCLGDSSAMYTAEQFSEAFYQAVGDGVTPLSSKLEVVASETMSVNVLPGTALARGRYLTVDQTETLPIAPANSYLDRYDAVVLRAYRKSEQVELVVVQGTPLGDPQKYTPQKNDTLWELVLAHVLVERGVISILSGNITDTREDPELCGFVTSLGDLSPIVESMRHFLGTGFDQRVESMLRESATLASAADAMMSRLNEATIEAGAGAILGDLQTMKGSPPSVNLWLLCDGSQVSSKYPDLIAIIGNKLPNIPSADPRFKTWIYAGLPTA